MAKSRRGRIALSKEDREHLEKTKTDPHSILRHVQRATIILHPGDSLTRSQTMRATFMSKPALWRWWDRFLVEGAGGLLHDIPRRRGRKPLSGDKVRQLIELAMSPPPAQASHWTLRTLAKKVGIAVSAVFGILKQADLKPRKAKTFKVSRDPRFELKVRDAAGLYACPSDHAVVIPAGEKTRIQALARTQTPLPMQPGHPGTGTHDDRCNGTACLMAALDLVSEGIRPGAQLHVVLDNVSSHKPAEVKEWLKDNANWTFHFTPSSASWMNAAGGFSSRLSRQRLRHAKCIAAIEGDIEHRNASDARPFCWGRKPEDLVEGWKKGHQKLQGSAS